MGTRGVIRPGAMGVKEGSGSLCPHLPGKSLLAFLTHQVMRSPIPIPTGRTGWPQSEAGFKETPGSPLRPGAKQRAEGCTVRQHKGERVEILTTQCAAPKAVSTPPGSSEETFRALPQNAEAESVFGQDPRVNQHGLTFRIWEMETPNQTPSSEKGMLRKKNEMHWSDSAFKR